MNHKVIKIFKIVAIASAIILVISVSYSLFSLTKLSDKTNTITVGAITLSLEEGETINIENAMPMNMKEYESGKNNPYKFTLTNNSKYPLNYNLYLEDVPFNENDKCKTVTWKNQDESTLNEVNCTEDLRMKNSLIAAKLQKKNSNEEIYSSVTSNNVNFVGQIPNTQGNDINDYTLLDNLQKDNKKLLLDKSKIEKNSSIDYNLELWIPTPIEYNSDNEDLSITSKETTTDGYTIYKTHKYKARIVIDAVQTTNSK